MKNSQDFTKGKILLPLLRFAMTVLFALFLQSLYEAVDLLIVGKFAEAADVSAVSTGSQIMMTLTGLVSSFAISSGFSTVWSLLPLSWHRASSARFA